MKVLFTWLGKTDIENMEKDKNAAISSIALNHPDPFDKIVIISNTWDEKWHLYEEWLQGKLAKAFRPYSDVTVNRVYIKTPIDYFTISKESQKWINTLSAESQSLYINLTSGTPAMSSVSIILGKAKSNIYFYQSDPSGKIYLDEMPFDFVAEYNASAARAISSKAVSIPGAKKAFENIVDVSDSATITF